MADETDNVVLASFGRGMTLDLALSPLPYRAVVVMAQRVEASVQDLICEVLGIYHYFIKQYTADPSLELILQNSRERYSLHFSETFLGRYIARLKEGPDHLQRPQQEGDARGNSSLTEPTNRYPVQLHLSQQGNQTLLQMSNTLQAPDIAAVLCEAFPFYQQLLQEYATDHRTEIILRHSGTARRISFSDTLLTRYAERMKRES